MYASEGERNRERKRKRGWLRKKIEERNRVGKDEWLGILGVLWGGPSEVSWRTKVVITT